MPYLYEFSLKPSHPHLGRYTLSSVLTSALLSVPHGFTTREGGVSEGPYHSLNLAVSSGDDLERVKENQRRVLEQFGYPPVALLDQLHGNIVHPVAGPGVWQGDGLLTNTPGLLLRVGVADCYPVLLHDPVRQVVGALHAGWRGVVAGILPRALEQMQQHYGSHLQDVRVALGPGISGPRFQVGPEVIEHFCEAGLTGSPQAPIYRPDPAQEGKYLLELAGALQQQARRAGIEHYWALGACTYADPRFFSHRRDRGQTGRMWALIQLPTSSF